MNLRNSIRSICSEKAFYMSVIGLLVALPLAEFITEIIWRFNEDIMPSFFQPQILMAFGIIGTLLTVLYWVSADYGRRKFRIADVFYFTLLFFMILSAVFSKNPGEYSRGYAFYCENPLHFLAYYWLYFAGTLIDDKKYRRNILFVYLGVALFQGIFAFLQTFNIELAYCPSYHAERAAYGLTQNSNFFAGLCLVFAACASGVYIFADELNIPKKMRYLILVLAAFLFYVMLGSRARLAWVGFAGLLIFYIISMAVMFRKDKESVRAPLKRSLILAGCFLAVFLAALFFTDYIREATVRSYWEVANGDVDKIGSDRIYNWKMGLSSVPGHWLTGVGLDNYSYVFLSDPGYQFGMYVQEKGHNEYLHTMVTQGVPALINYLALLIYACGGAVKSILKRSSGEERAVTWILLGMFASYAVQAFFNSSIINVVVYFWFVIGLITPRTVIKPDKNRLNSADL